MAAPQRPPPRARPAPPLPAAAAVLLALLLAGALGGARGEWRPPGPARTGHNMAAAPPRPRPAP